MEGSQQRHTLLLNGEQTSFSLSCQKVFWDTIEGMIRRGQTADVAINNVYQAYGWNNSVTQILNRMMDDRRKGVKRV